MELSQKAMPTIKTLASVASDFLDAGFRLYLVGGIVRDLAFGHCEDGMDVDLTTDAPVSTTKAILERHASVIWTQGERFGTIGAHVDGLAVEITTHRSEAYDSESRKPSVVFEPSLHADLSRRDFTINAMAISIPDGEFFDPFEGLKDLEDRRLRTPLSPVESFSDDPLRMLRAARFLPRFDLECATELLAAAAELADRLAVVSAERIHAELDRLLAVTHPDKGFEFLLQSGLLSEAIPTFKELSKDQRREAVELASVPGPSAARRAGLFFPLFESRGEDSVRLSLQALRWSTDIQDETVALLRYVGWANRTNPQASDVRRLVAAADLRVTAVSNEGAGLRDETVLNSKEKSSIAFIENLKIFTSNMVNLRAGGPAEPRFFVLLDQMVDGGAVLEFQPALTGHQLMKLLDVGQGPVIGKAARHLKELWVAHGDMSLPEVERAVVEWHNQHYT